MKRIRVVIADDSSLFRDILRQLLAADDIDVVADVATGEQAIERVEALAPDLVTIDIGMPGIGGLATIERIMAHRPVPILVVTGQPAGDGSHLVFEAIARGALDIVAKDALGPSGRVDVRQLVRRLASVPVVRHVGVRREEPPVRASSAGRVRDIMAIASSSGGPSAVAQLLGALPASFGASVLVVQHLPFGFAASFARFLREHVQLKVAVVEERAALTPGVVLLPPDDRHLIASAGESVEASASAPIGGHRPSATALFESLARTHAARTIGIMLTGMGDDGVRGLLALKRAGGATVAQDQHAAVWGMPKAAVEAGAADQVLGLEGIARLVETTCGKR